MRNNALQQAEHAQGFILLVGDATDRTGSCMQLQACRWLQSKETGAVLRSRFWGQHQAGHGFRLLVSCLMHCHATDRPLTNAVLGAAGPLVLLMQQERSYEVRAAILDAVLHTGSPSILSAIAHAGNFVPVCSHLVHRLCASSTAVRAVLPHVSMALPGAEPQHSSNCWLSLSVAGLKRAAIQMAEHPHACSHSMRTCLFVERAYNVSCPKAPQKPFSWGQPTSVLLSYSHAEQSLC